MNEFPGFLFVTSDLYNHTPNLQVEILRDQAKLNGVSETRILNLLHTAYSQNYTYLIKKATDQYQVIVEVKDNERSEPQDLSLLYIKSDDGQRVIPLGAITRWNTSVGPQAVEPHQPVHQRNPFLQSEAWLHDWRGNRLCREKRQTDSAPRNSRRTSGRSSDISRNRFQLCHPHVAGGLRDVRDSGDPV